jgi:hypothetical protein
LDRRAKREVKFTERYKNPQALRPQLQGQLRR